MLARCCALRVTATLRPLLLRLPRLLAVHHVCQLSCLASFRETLPCPACDASSCMLLGMRLILSHQSALEFWKSGAMLGSVSVPGSGRARGLMPDSFAAAVSSIEAADLQSRYGLSLPLHTLVSGKSRTDNRPGLLVTHVWANPEISDCFFRALPDMFVCSPEIVFLQMSAVLPFLELIKLGFELCGRYAVSKDGVEYSREPLTSVERIKRVVERHRHLPGIRNARHALAYIRNDSYSPRETAVAMLLGLPYKFGGASFGMPVMNYSVELHDEARRLVGQRICKCDLYYPKCKLDLEYDSYEYHSGPAKMEHDSLRRDALALEGIKVLTVTNTQITNQAKLGALIHLVANASGKRFRPQCGEYLLRQSRLIDVVISDSFHWEKMLNRRGR